MPPSRRFITFKNKLKQFRLPVLVFVLFWLVGLLIIYFTENDNSFWHVLQLSVCITNETSNPGFINFYQFLWPLMFELLILSFILSTLQDFYGYNPVLNARKIAAHQKNHTVVLGYNHLGERIVDCLRKNKQPYSLIEIDMDKVDDLITFDQPVIIGDYTDINIIKQAGVGVCKEVFCVTNDLREALIAVDKVRKVNKTCDIYMRVFDEHFRDYFSSEPWNAFTFSTSKWTMDSVQKWSREVEQDDIIVVLGNDNIVKRIVDFYGEMLQVKTYLLDPEIDPEVYNDLPNVYPYKERVQFVENLDERFDMKEVSQMYICWNTKELFSDAILLTLAIKKQYPHISLFVRMFDEELARIAKTFDATTFSTSAYAFKMLQKEVKKESGIYPKKDSECS
ncbi:MAG: NAD(P)-binding protein [Asgard group archaeon]|nr:NAD(P)-binding protein [Asgard group archaeon]